VVRSIRKPLVILTPKRLLRYPEAISTLKDFSDGQFQRIITDVRFSKKTQSKRAIFCSGKVYYDLLEHQRELGDQGQDVAIHRVEQLYPLTDIHFKDALSTHAGTEILWVQEEPINQGAWPHFLLTFGNTLNGFALRCIARPASASPATGSAASHKIEQAHLLNLAFQS
jgi:2-oxoglutarate dehydrogenase E1 component